MAYMGDVPTKQSSNFHIHQILSAGIIYMSLRDEVYSQIIKQTTSNPSRLSNTKGWQAMALCCGTFLPSESFYPYLNAHLEQVVDGNIARKGTADTLGMYGQGMVNPSEAAAYCLERLQKVKKIGSRCLLPLLKEINCVETMDTIPSEVSLPDGSWQAFILKPMYTIEEVVEHLVNILGLREAPSYGLFQLESNGVEKLIRSNAYILEVEASCNILATTPQNIQDIRYGAKTLSKFTRIFCGSGKDDHVDNSLNTVVLGSGDRGQSPFSEGKLHMLLKRKLYLVDLATLPERPRAAVLAFEYTQAVHDIVQGVHIVSEGDAMMLGAMQLRADLGTSRVTPEILADIDGSKYGPQYCVQGNEGAWKDAIATTLVALPYSDNTMNWKQDYIDYVKSRCPLYEACRFFVRPLSNLGMPQDMYLAVSSTGVSFVNAHSRESINFLEYAEIASWGYTTTAFSIIAGSMTISTDNQFETTQGLEIANTIQLYVDLIQTIQQKSVQAQPRDREQPWNPLQGVEGSFGSSDGFQGAHMMQPQQNSPFSDVSDLDQSKPLPPQQPPGYVEESIQSFPGGEEEQQLWGQPLFSPPGENQSITAPPLDDEQQAIESSEEPVDGHRKHRKHRKHGKRKKEKHDGNSSEEQDEKHHRDSSEEGKNEKQQRESSGELKKGKHHRESSDDQKKGKHKESSKERKKGKHHKETSDERKKGKHHKETSDERKKGKHHKETSDERKKGRHHKETSDERKKGKHLKESSKKQYGKQHTDSSEDRHERTQQHESGTPQTSPEQGLQTLPQSDQQFSDRGQAWQQTYPQQSLQPGQGDVDGGGLFGGELW